MATISQVGVAIVNVVVFSAVILALGCQKPLTQGVEQIAEGDSLRAYRLNLKVTSTNRSDLVVEVEVTNTSDKNAGWDSEFSAAIFFDVWISAYSDRNDGRLLTPEASTYIDPEKIGVISDDKRLNRFRFVTLKPGESRVREVTLSRGFRRKHDEVLSAVPPAQGTLARGTEGLFRYRFPDTAASIDMCVRYYAYPPTFRQAFGAFPAEVSMLDGEVACSNVLRIQLQ